MSLNYLGQDYQNEVQHDFFGHVMPLALASVLCDVGSMLNDTFAFLGQDN